MTETDIVFCDGVFMFFKNGKVMLDRLTAGILIVDFSFHLVKASLCILIPSGESVSYVSTTPCP